MKNKDKIIEYNKDYYRKHKKQELDRNKDWRRVHKLELVKYDKIRNEKYREEHKEEIIERSKLYRNTHKKQIKERNKKYIYNRRKGDLNFRIRYNLSCRIYSVLKGINKSKNTMKLVGCSIYFLKKYLESKFTEGMSFSNYGKWHIDHIIPCASFNLLKPEEQAKCFHYTNLQPLWALDNIKKSDKT